MIGFICSRTYDEIKYIIILFDDNSIEIIEKNKIETKGEYILIDYYNYSKINKIVIIFDDNRGEWIDKENIYDDNEFLCIKCDICISDNFKEDMLYDVNPIRYNDERFNAYARGDYKILRCIKNGHVKCLEYIWNMQKEEQNDLIRIRLNGYSEFHECLKKYEDIDDNKNAVIFAKNHWC